MISWSAILWAGGYWSVQEVSEKMSLETHTRAWIKSIVWRIFGIAILGAISWIVTHSWKEMSLITILFHSIRVVLYYVHERIWEKIQWGRIKHPLSVLPVKKALTPKDLKIVRSQLKDLGYLDWNKEEFWTSFIFQLLSSFWHLFASTSIRLLGWAMGRPWLRFCLLWDTILFRLSLRYSCLSYSRV